MSTPILDALARITTRRFQSFAEAATSVLDLLSAAGPGERLALAQIDWEEGICRVIDSRGEEMPLRGMVVPLAAPLTSSGSIQTGELLDAQALTSVGFGGAQAVPLDSSDGSTVGVMLATGAGPHISLLPTCARLLSYEWESISTRAELRRLAELARDRDRTDPVTGLDNRRSLMDALEREWSLSRRGTVVSYLVTTRIADRAALAARSGQAAADLLLKDVAEVFTGGVRRTDYLARIDDDILASVLVGCKDTAGVLAFAARCERALLGVTSGRSNAVELAYAWSPLADAASAEEALDAAVQAVRDATPHLAGAMVKGSEAA